MEDGNRLLTRQEAAARLGISVWSVRKLDLPVVRPTPGGRAVRIRAADLEAWVRLRSTRPAWEAAGPRAARGTG